jgi:glucose/arabinose dehydrogenase
MRRAPAIFLSSVAYFLSSVACFLALPAPAGAEPVAAPWLEGLAFPTNLAFAPDGRLLFTEKDTGSVRIVGADGGLRDDPFVRFGVTNAGETGLLGIALDPRFANGSPWVYLYLSDATTGSNELVRVRTDGDTGTRVEPLRTFLPTAGVYHNGGELLFAQDGYLYVTVGEGHDPGRAQDASDVGGSVLRLTDSGDAAPGTPFGDANPVYTIGHRNSFGLCEDPSTGTIWETENGPDVDDEVNRLTAGGNYGWPQTTGDSGGRYVDPVVVFRDTVALTGCAWWGGALYVGSFNDGLVRRVDIATGDTSPAVSFPSGVTDLQVGPDGALYVATVDTIWRLATPPLEPIAAPEPVRSEGGGGSWVALLAALVLAIGLGARIVAGHRLRKRR